jgi:hypothetical protein
MSGCKYLYALVLVVFCPIAASATDADAWRIWQADLERQCPSNHVDWISDGGYDDFLADFENTLSIRKRRQLYTVADTARLCAKETVGFYCEMGATLNAFNDLGLMKTFVSFDCRHYRCNDVADCKRS